MITRYALLTAIVVCIVLSFALYLSTKTQQKIDDHAPRIAKLEAEKQSAKQKAEASEARAKALTDDLQRVEKQSKVIREKLRKGDKDRAESMASPAPPPAPPPVMPSWAQEKLKLQDELITALENELSVETAKVEAWKESSDNWKKAFQQSERQIECLKIAHEAHLKAVHVSRWKGRLEGFAIGFGTGYLGGKLP